MTAVRLVTHRALRRQPGAMLQQQQRDFGAATEACIVQSCVAVLHTRQSQSESHTAGQASQATNAPRNPPDPLD
jgi:hypothetical protein